MLHPCPANHSTIDHFIVSVALTNQIASYNSLQDGHNVSFHCAIIIKIYNGMSYLLSNNQTFILKPT